MGRKSKTPEKIKCIGDCGRELTLANFYNTKSPMFPSGKAPLCKKCIKEMIDYDDMQSIYDILQSLDLPFIYDIWYRTVDKKPKDVFGNYIRQINSLNQYEGMRYKDSQFEPNKNESINRETITNEGVISEEMKLKWGSNFNSMQIKKMEKFYNDMCQNYKIETTSHKDYLLKISKVSLKMDECLDNDEIGGFAKYSNVYDNLMKSAKFTAVQRSAVDDTGGLTTICEFIDRLETEGFIEPAKIEEDYDVVEATISDIKKFTKNLVLGDPSISTLAQETLLKMKTKQEEVEVQGEEDE